MYYVRNIEKDGRVGIVDTKDCVIEFLSKDLFNQTAQAIKVESQPTKDVAYDYKSANNLAQRLYKSLVRGDNCTDFFSEHSFPAVDFVLNGYGAHAGKVLKVYQYDHNYEFMLLCTEMINNDTFEYMGLVVIRIGKYGGATPYVFVGGRVRKTYPCGTLYMFTQLSGVQVNYPEGIYVGVDVGNKTVIVNVLETEIFKYTYDKII